MITGIRGLCNGLGPALYGFVFYLFHVELNEMDAVDSQDKDTKLNMANPTDEVPYLGRAPRFLSCSLLSRSFCLLAVFRPRLSLLC